MADLIDRQAAIEKSCEVYYWCGYEDSYDDFVPLDEIKALPTIEAEPVIHSKWEITEIDHAYGHKCYHCPECGWDEWRYESTKRCPNCGAKMDLEG